MSHDLEMESVPKMSFGDLNCKTNVESNWRNSVSLKFRKT